MGFKMMDTTQAPSLIILTMLFLIHCSMGYESAYDLIQQRNRYVGSDDKLYRRSAPYDRSSIKFSPRIPAPSPKAPWWRTHWMTQPTQPGNGYDNMRNSEFFRPGVPDWNTYPKFSRSDSSYFDIQNSDRFNGDTISDYGRYNFRETDPIRRVDRPFYPFRKEEMKERPIYGSRSSGGEFFSSKPFLGDSSRGIFTRRTLPKLLLPRQRTSELFSKPRIVSTVHHRERPAFYSKDYFARRADVPTAGATHEAEKTDGNFEAASGDANDSVFVTSEGLLSSNEGKEEKKSDVGYQDNTEEAVSDVANKEKVGETTRFDKNGGNKSTVRLNRVSKKGHTTKGFASHHHKDETGNTTTFFDESSDSGGQEDYQDQADEFGTRRTMEVLNGKEDGRFFKENGGRSGKFGSGSLQDKSKVEKDIVAKNNRYNNDKTFGTGQDEIDRAFKSDSEYLGGGLWGDVY